MFIKNTEDFICEHCGTAVTGDGYTNHCRECLWSKHVDIEPGDRASTCGGMMEPINVEIKSGEHILVHRCVKCGYQKHNKLANTDNFDTLLALCMKIGMKP